MNPREDTDLKTSLNLPPEFTGPDALPLLLSEVASLLQHRQAQGDIVDYGGRGIFDQTNDYCKKFFYFRTTDNIQIVRNALETTAGLEPVEVAMVGSIVPGGYDEAVTLFPSLEAKDPKTMEEALVEVNNAKQSLV